MPNPEREPEETRALFDHLSNHFRAMHTIVPSGPAVSEIEEELAAQINQIETESDIENVIVWHREQVVGLRSKEILSEPAKRQRRILGGLKRKAKRERQLFDSTGNEFYKTLAEAWELVVERVQEKRVGRKDDARQPSGLDES